MIMKGQKINDRYQIVRTIGEGGMANVYLAYDTILDRNVAVKVLRGDLATDEKFVRRFQREALSASSLSHPNIVEVYDVGEDNGSYYIVMEYIEGKHLKQLLKKRETLTLTEVVDIMLQVTDGMSAAHDSYIIHRDIKPQNIMILENGLIKITDFGIAMALNSTQLTQTNSVMGSVHYLPPEQASGKGATIQSDVYSMGILMYELLTGSLPFRGDNAVEIALKHIKEPFPSVKERIPSIPQSIDNIIRTSTAKNVKNRYKDAKEMHDDLKTALDDSRANEPLREFVYPEDEFESKQKKVSASVDNINSKKEEKDEEEIVARKITENDLKKSENKILLILAGIFTGLVVIVTTLVFLLPVITKVKDVEIPNIANKSIVEAEKILKSKGLSVASETKELASSEIAAGNVVKSSPQIGRTVKKGTEVTLYISTGENCYIVENLVGKNYKEVKGKLESKYNLYVKISKVEDKTRENVEEIIKTEPGVGTKLSEGDTITLIVPDIVTEYLDFTKGSYTLKDIEAWCDKYGVTLLPIYEETSEFEAGTIFNQSQKAGSTVRSGETLKIYIAQEIVSDLPDNIDTDMPTGDE